MQSSDASVDELLQLSVGAAQRGGAAALQALEDLPVAIYVTDADGTITYYNRACVPLAGRVPVVGRDRWCVTWRLYTSKGAFLPHPECPMAVAIRERRPVRCITALAERPDGTRTPFLPMPTPLLDEDGGLIGAVNVLVDLTESLQRDRLRAKGEKCRRLARSIGEQKTADSLLGLASEYDAAVEFGTMVSHRTDG